MWKSVIFAVAGVTTLSNAAPSPISSLEKRCTGETFAHVDGWNDGCGKGIKEFSYDFTTEDCSVRCANTDSRAHYLTRDASGSSDHGVAVLYYNGRDCKGDNYKQAAINKDQCLKIDAGFTVQSILFLA